MDIKVSVIVPVYNVAPYLERCLESIINQTLREIEIICVDNGSTDNSMEILHRYQAEDPRIMILSQQNSGVAAARNHGMDHAAGEYMIFWDSDDYFDLQTLEKMYQKVKEDNADICVCGRVDFYELPQKSFQIETLINKKYLPETIPFNIKTLPDYILNFTGAPVWNKLFRKEFITENQLFFPVIISGSDDVYFTALALCLAKSITILNEPFIKYQCFHEESYTATMHKRSELFVVYWKMTMYELKKRGVFPERSFANRVLSSSMGVLKLIRFSWPIFQKFYYQLKDEYLQEFGVVLREPGYYYNPWHEELLEHIYNESAEEFLMSYLYITHEMLWECRASRQRDVNKLKAAKEKELGTLQKKLDQSVHQIAILPILSSLNCCCSCCFICLGGLTRVRTYLISVTSRRSLI